MYLYEIVSDLELHKQGINIDKFVIHRSMKQAREQRLMIIQYNAMQTYADVLLQRIGEIKERL